MHDQLGVLRGVDKRQAGKITILHNDVCFDLDITTPQGAAGRESRPKVNIGASRNGERRQINT